ncbi:MAG TPA: dihydrofolate reductase family protein [Mycobacteriales bacterium]|nr:dihydrofolate reductase family protein [Mycobacteriales bacterium]
MRDLIVTENITLDGVIDLDGGWFSPAGSAEADQSDLEAALREQREAADAVLFGRRTFEDMRGYWPHHTDEPSGTGAYLDAVPKYVVSRTLADPQWSPSTVLADLEAVRQLKDRPGRDIVATGSIQLVHALIERGLVDEFRLFVYPVVVGRGERLFVDAGPRLSLAQSTAFRNGVVLLRYRM